MATMVGRHVQDRRLGRLSPRTWAAGIAVFGLAMSAAACGGATPSAVTHAPPAGIGASTGPAGTDAGATSAGSADPLSDQSLAGVDTLLSTLDQSVAQADRDSTPAQGDS